MPPLSRQSSLKMRAATQAAPSGGLYVFVFLRICPGCGLWSAYRLAAPLTFTHERALSQSLTCPPLDSHCALATGFSASEVSAAAGAAGAATVTHFSPS